MKELNYSKLPYSKLFAASLIFCLTVGLVALMFISRTVILAGLTGVGVGCLASPFLTFLNEKAKVPRALGALFLILLLAVLFLTLFFVSGMVVADQWKTFESQIPSLLQTLEERWSALVTKYPPLANSFDELSLVQSFKTGSLTLLQGLGSGVNAVAGIVLAFFIALYTAIQSRQYFMGWLYLFPPRHQETARELSIKSAHVLRQWFSAQLIDMAVVGALTAFGLWLVGSQYWAIFGAMTGLLAIVPYFGTLITLVLVTLVTLASQTDIVWWVLLVFFVVQQIEGNILLPIIMRERVKLPEAPLLFVIVLMSLWFGVLGILIAPGLFAIGRMLFLELLKAQRKYVG